MNRSIPHLKQNGLQRSWTSGLLILALAGSVVAAPGCKSPAVAAGATRDASPGKVSFWLTTPDQKNLLTKQSAPLAFGTPVDANPVIEVDGARTFQTMDGFGCALTGGSAYHINRMGRAQQDALLQELFGTGEGAIGISYLRISIGSSDLNAEPFTYDDMPAGQTDPTLAHFSIERDRQDVIPVLKKIRAINPQIKILGSPWTAPPWMKDSLSFIGSRLNPANFAVYAQYFVKYIKAMEAEDLPIDAITVQNEPLHKGNNPSMYMLATEQNEFVRNHLGPAFRQAGIKTKIIIYDHNLNRPDYPLTLLNDPETRKYVDGSAFHHYGKGGNEAMTRIHEAHPDKNIYFTEQWVPAPQNFPRELKWHVETLIIGAPRNWSRNVLEWNLAADPNLEPHTPNGGCKRCVGALTISGNEVTRNVAYYIMGHASKFVRPGAVRIQSNEPTGLPNVAFRNPDGTRALIVINTGKDHQGFNIKYNGKIVVASLDPGAVGTFTW